MRKYFQFLLGCYDIGNHYYRGRIHFQFLLGCYLQVHHIYPRHLYPFQFLLGCYGGQPPTSPENILFQFLLGCYWNLERRSQAAFYASFNSFWDATLYAIAAPLSKNILSIPFGMLPSVNVFTVKDYVRTFNSFWDATHPQRTR